MASKVDENLQDVLSDWSGVEGKPYGQGRQLKTLWGRGHPTTPAYDPTGIVELITGIKGNAFFRECDKAKKLKPGQFKEGGGLKTIGNLFQFLRPCDEEE
jgi:hypothetical protein